MSKFSEKLKILIDESGLKIYQISKSSDLDRTTIQRAITGERLPSLNFVHKLIEFLRLSPTEKMQLLDLYSISKIGEKAFTGRKYIKDMIERIATTCIQNNEAYMQKSILFSGKVHDDCSVYTGQYIVNNVIQNILEDEAFNNSNPEILIYVPFNNNFLFDLLQQLYLSRNGNITIINLIKLIKNFQAQHNLNYNLEVFSHVIPFSFSAGNGYKPYYYYDNYNSTNDIALFMPYYIITSKHVVTISSDYKTAIIYGNNNILEIYKDNFTMALSYSKPLTLQHFYCEDMLIAYLESYKNMGEVSHVLEPQPCLAWYYTDEIIDSHLRKDIENRDVILNMLFDLFGAYRQIECRPISIFSAKGLSDFARTGILADLPTQFAIPFTLDERIMLLKRLKNDILNNNYKVYAINASKFIIPSITIQIYRSKGLDFFATNNNGEISSSFIDEKSISEAFYDFFDSIECSDLIYSIEETIKIIDIYIDLCNDSKVS